MAVKASGDVRLHNTSAKPAGHGAHPYPGTKSLSIEKMYAVGKTSERELKSRPGLDRNSNASSYLPKVRRTVGGA
jgi:hypothetical protein